MPEKPTSEKKTLDQVWYGFYGAPGSIGLLDRVETIEKILNGKKNCKKPKRLEIIGADTLTLFALISSQCIRTSAGPGMMRGLGYSTVPTLASV